jgi:hypothetical protein
MDGSDERDTSEVTQPAPACSVLDEALRIHQADVAKCVRMATVLTKAEQGLRRARQLIDDALAEIELLWMEYPEG